MIGGFLQKVALDPGCMPRQVSHVLIGPDWQAHRLDERITQ